MEKLSGQAELFAQYQEASNVAHPHEIMGPPACLAFFRFYDHDQRRQN